MEPLQGAFVNIVGGGGVRWRKNFKGIEIANYVGIMGGIFTSESNYLIWLSFVLYS